MIRFPAERVHLWLMLVLTFTTGINDAVGYLGLHKVFTGNMTGNVVVLGMALVGHTSLPVLGPALALLGFMAGAAAAGRTLRSATTPWNGLVTVIFASVAVVMVALGVALLVGGETPAHPEPFTTIAAVAMGAQAAAARHIGVKDVTTVVVTSTITGLAADSPLGSGRAPWRGGGTARRLVAVVAILVGAVVGAVAWRSHHLSAGLLVAGVLIAAVTLVGELHRRAA